MSGSNAVSDYSRVHWHIRRVPRISNPGRVESERDIQRGAVTRAKHSGVVPEALAGGAAVARRRARLQNNRHWGIKTLICVAANPKARCRYPSWATALTTDV